MAKKKLPNEFSKSKVIARGVATAFTEKLHRVIFKTFAKK